MPVNWNIVDAAVNMYTHMVDNCRLYYCLCLCIYKGCSFIKPTRYTQRYKDQGINQTFVHDYINSIVELCQFVFCYGGALYLEACLSNSLGWQMSWLTFPKPVWTATWGAGLEWHVLYCPISLIRASLTNMGLNVHLTITGVVDGAQGVSRLITGADKATKSVHTLCWCVSITATVVCSSETFIDVYIWISKWNVKVKRL